LLSNFNTKIQSMEQSLEKLSLEQEEVKDDLKASHCKKLNILIMISAKCNRSQRTRQRLLQN